MGLKSRKIDSTWPEGKQKVFTMSYDDGNDSDIRLVETMRRHHVKGTFHINSGLCPEKPLPYRPDQAWRRLTMGECLDLYGDDMEIAVHGRFHPAWDRMPPPCAMQDILDDRRELERATGKIIRGAAFPYGGYSDQVVEILRLAGIAYCRTTITTGSVKSLPQDFLRLKATVHNTDPAVYDIARQFVGPKDPNTPLWMMYLWGHSYEFCRDDSWQVIEGVLSLVGDREDVWYATNIQMVDYLNAVRALQFNIDQTQVYNPTDRAVWLRVSCGGETEAVLPVPSGGTVSLPGCPA